MDSYYPVLQYKRDAKVLYCSDSGNSLKPEFEENKRNLLLDFYILNVLYND